MENEVETGACRILAGIGAWGSHSIARCSVNAAPLVAQHDSYHIGFERGPVTKRDKSSTEVTTCCWPLRV